MDITSIQTFISDQPYFALILIVWMMAWKGAALWKAAQLGQRNWFIAILIINTLGLLEIIYIFFIAKKYEVEVVESKD